MTEYEFELECMVFMEIQNVLSGAQKPGPSTQFNETLQTLLKTQGVHVAGSQEVVEVTPEEMGWTK